MAASTGVIAMWGFEPRGTRGIEKKERVVWLSARLKVLSGRPEHRGEARECDDVFSQFQKPQASCHQFLQPLALDQE